MPFFGPSVWLLLAILTIFREIDLHFAVRPAFSGAHNSNRPILGRIDRHFSLKIMTLACARALACGVATPIVGDETDPPYISGTQHEFSCTKHAP